VWYGLAHKNGRAGSAHEAILTLERFWETFAAIGTAEKILNYATYSAYRLREYETPILGIAAPVVTLNPRGAIIQAITTALPFLGIRRQYYDLTDLLNAACPDFDRVDWEKSKARLLAGATDIMNGIETVFDSYMNLNQAALAARSGTAKTPARIWRQRRRLSLSGIAASGTLPDVREAEEIDGRSYWDGLYSLNPPIREFWEGVDKAYMPDEIWVIRINPQQMAYEPRSHADVEDRENELMGNLTLNKELDFIEHMNLLLQQPHGQAMLGPHFKQVKMRTIKMTTETSAKLHYSTKFNRDRDWINKLRDEGYRVGREWLDTPPTGPQDYYPHDVGHWPPRP
jgi:NTE family protein